MDYFIKKYYYYFFIKTLNMSNFINNKNNTKIERKKNREKKFIKSKNEIIEKDQTFRHFLTMSMETI